MQDIKTEFQNDMIKIYKTASKELNYKAKRFLDMISSKGAYETARILVTKSGGTDGFTVLWEHKRLDLSVERWFAVTSIKVCLKILL